MWVVICVRKICIGSDPCLVWWAGRELRGSFARSWSCLGASGSFYRANRPTGSTPPILAPFTNTSGFLPYGPRGLEHLPPFPFSCFIIFGGNLCVGSSGKWISLQMIPSRALKRTHPREDRAQGHLGMYPRTESAVVELKFDTSQKWD